SSSWTFSNWPLYIDVKNKTDHPSLDMFDKKYNTTTKYLEDIEDNDSFFGKVKAQLEAGQSIDRDIVTLTDWMAGKWVALGYAEKAVDAIQPHVADGQIRRFTGNDYAGDLAKGNVVACMAWSGDVVQLQYDNPDLKFVIPDKGGMIWTDNMMIPKNAANPYNA